MHAGGSNKYWKENTDVADNQTELENHLVPIGELSGYTIEKGDPDPRGFKVVDPQSNRLGTVSDLIVDREAMKVRYLVVDLDGAAAASSGSTVLLDTKDVDISDDRSEVYARRYGAAGFDAASGARRYTPRQATGTGERRITRSEEELRVGTREVSRGEARVSKHVETEHVREPVTRQREEVVIERRPVEAGARADASIGDEEVRIPLMEEEVVVEKRPVVKEELVVGKRVVEQKDVVEADVRREEFDIDTADRGKTEDHRVTGERVRGGGDGRH
jgi:uncharacterized protein (TIGR02271 family)